MDTASEALKLKKMQYPEIKTCRNIVISSVFIVVFALSVFAQSQANRRETFVFTYPIDKTTTVPLHADSKFAGVTGQAKVDVLSGGGAEVKVSVSNLPSVFDIGGRYTTYMLWAIAADGSAQRLQEIKSETKGLNDTGLKATVPMSSFALIITAEPHYLVRIPSRAVVLENSMPKTDEARFIKSTSIQYSVNDSDYFRSQPPVAKKDKTSRKVPLSLLGAQNAVELARYAGAENDAPDEYNEAITLLEQTNAKWNAKAEEKEIDIFAAKTISIAAAAEKKAEENRLKRIIETEKRRKTAELNDAKEELKMTKTRKEELEEELARTVKEKERYRAEYEAKSQINERLQRELDELKLKSEKESQIVAQLRFEKELLQRRFAFINEIPNLEKNMQSFGTVKRDGNSLTVILPETLWFDLNSSEPEVAYLEKVTPLLQKIAERNECAITISVFTDEGEDISASQKLAETRADILMKKLLELKAEKNNLKVQGFVETQETATTASAPKSEPNSAPKTGVKGVKKVPNAEKPIPKTSKRRTEINLRLLDIGN